ncbi:hypothetical protein FS837_007463 [Tulasnella sp. UAMH 9824]|nr:hypothetical protein FS837_007463 [Tulasnella sp. UAMH 9824]
MKDDVESGAPELDTRKDDSRAFQGGVQPMDITASSSANPNGKGRGKKLPDKSEGISGTSNSIQEDKQKKAPKAFGDGSREIDIKAGSSAAAPPQVLDKFETLNLGQEYTQEGASSALDDGDQQRDTIVSSSTNLNGAKNGKQAPAKPETIPEGRNLGQQVEQDDIPKASNDGAGYRDPAALYPAHSKGKQKSDQVYRRRDDLQAFDDIAPLRGTAASSSAHPRGLLRLASTVIAINGIYVIRLLGAPTGKRTGDFEAQKIGPLGRQENASQASIDGAEPRDPTVSSSAQQKGWFKSSFSAIALKGSRVVQLPEAITEKQKTEVMPEVQKPIREDMRKDTSKVINDGAGSKDPIALSSATLKGLENGKKTPAKPEASSEAPKTGRRDKQSESSGTYDDALTVIMLTRSHAILLAGETAPDQKPEANVEAQKSYQASKWKGGSQAFGNGSLQSDTAGLSSAPPRGVPTGKQSAKLDDQETSPPDWLEYISQVADDGAELRKPSASSPVHSKGGTTEKQVTTKPVTLSGSDKPNHKDNQTHMSNPFNDAGEQGGSKTSSKDTATGNPVVAGHDVVSHNSNQGEKPKYAAEAPEDGSKQGTPTASSALSSKGRPRFAFIVILLTNSYIVWFLGVATVKQGAATSQTIFESHQPNQREKQKPPTQVTITGAGQGGSTTSSSPPHPNAAGSGKEITPGLEAVSENDRLYQREKQQDTPGTGNGGVRVSAGRPGPKPHRSDRHGVVPQGPSNSSTPNFPLEKPTPDLGGSLVPVLTAVFSR